MYTKWTEHLKDQKDIENFKIQIQHSKDVLDRLIQILNEKERDLTLREISIATYEHPNWAERQAHQNGFRSCLHHIRKLIDLNSKIGEQG